MKPVMIERRVGNCLTEFKRANYDVLVPMMKMFIKFGQWDTHRLMGRSSLDVPHISAGEILVGIDEAGNHHDLIMIVDSSD